MIKIILKKAVVFFVLIFIVFVLLAENSEAVIPATLCTKHDDRMELLVRIAFWTDDLTPFELDAKIPVFKNEIENAWSSQSVTACNKPVKVIVETRKVTGYSGNWETAGETCNQNNSGYHCVKITKDKVSGGGSYTLGEVKMFLFSYNLQAVGWWWANYTSGQTAAHETGHILGLDDEYATTADKGPNNIMGNGIGPVLSKHVNTIVTFSCIGNNTLCNPSYTPTTSSRTSCCKLDTGCSDINVCVPDSAYCPIGITCTAECKCDANLPVAYTVTSSPSTAATGGPSTPAIGAAGGIFDFVSCIRSGDCTVCDIVQVAVNISVFLIGIVGAIVLLLFVYGGFMILASGGSPEKVAQGKKILIGAVVGLIIVLFAYAGVNLVLNVVTGGQGFDWIKKLKCP